MFVSVILGGIFVLLLSVFYKHRRQQMRHFEDIGVPGPKPNFLLGNLTSFNGKRFSDVYEVWQKIYGKTFGYYEGPAPVLVTSDLDLLQQVFVKQFSKFHARKSFPVQVDGETDPDVHMFFAQGDRWKRLRSIINPAFSTSKMRMMTPSIIRCMNTFVGELNKKTHQKQEFNIYDVFQRLTLDVIVTFSIGMQSNALQEKEDPFLRNAQQILIDTTKRTWLFALGYMFPILHNLWIFIFYALGHIQGNPVVWMEQQLSRLVHQRKLETDAANHTDLMQMMLNMETDQESENTKNKHRKSGRLTGDSKYLYDDNMNLVKTQANMTLKPKQLTLKEIQSQCFLFTMSGYETTSTTLAYLAYELTQNMDVQRKLQLEIDEHFPDKDDVPDYDNIRHLKYLDMVLCETLRKYPLASVVIARKCAENCKVNGIEMHKGTVVQANVWSIHYDPEHWGPHTERFVPERFLPEIKKQRHPMAWMPFGGGPRTCIGQRIAMLKAKMTVIYLMKNFTLFEPMNSEPLKLVEGATVSPINGVRVKLVNR